MSLKEVDSDGLLVWVGEISFAESLDHRRLANTAIPHNHHLCLSCLSRLCLIWLELGAQYCKSRQNFHLHHAFKVILHRGGELLNEHHLRSYSLYLQTNCLFPTKNCKLIKGLRNRIGRRWRSIRGTLLMYQSLNERWQGCRLISWWSCWRPLNIKQPLVYKHTYIQQVNMQNCSLITKSLTC